MGRIFSYAFCFLFFCLAFALANAAGAASADTVHLVKVDSMALGRDFLDDGDSNSLMRALEHSRRFLASSTEGNDSSLLSSSTLTRTLDELEEVVRQNPSGWALAKEIYDRFDFYVVRSGRQGYPMLVTGYYEPEFAGSLQRQAPFLYPVYGVPDDLVLSSGRPGVPRVWRRQNNLLYTYWRRSEIDAASLPALHALVYLADPVEVFLLHVQGSGRIKLPDGSVKMIRYAANNGLPYRSIGKLLVERGMMPLEEVSMPRIVAYLRAHPEERQEILNYNERYIFFRWARPDEGEEAEEPVGSMGEPLTAGRSVALDPMCYPPGAVGFLLTRQPRFDQRGRLFSWVSLHRLVFAQDSGGAIKGPGRLDMFYGNGPFAEKAAGVMRQEGSFLLLVKKGEKLNLPNR